MSTQTLPVLSSDAGLSAYLTEIKKFPILSVEEEYALADRFRDHGDVKAAHSLVTSHLRLVAKIAMGYRHYGLPVSDLISEGNIGLMRAVKKFEPERGFRLSTYAMWWIKAAINEYILSSWSLVKMGTVAAQKKLFFNLRKMKAKLGLYEDGDLGEEHARKIAQDLGVPEGEVVEMNRRLAARDSSLSAPVGEDSELSRIDLLEDDRESQEDVLAQRQEAALDHRLLHDALADLNERERDIIARRQLSEAPVTLEDLGAHYGISRERVRQIEARALEKLKDAMVSAKAALLDPERALPAPARGV